MKPDIRKATRYVPLTQEEFKKRYFARFVDPAFDTLQPEIEKLAATAYDAYIDYRKSPRTQPAGPEFKDPDQRLPVEWLSARQAIREAEQRHHDRLSPPRILLINGASRSEHSCPGEISKTSRLTHLAEDIIRKNARFEVDLLDLSDLITEPGRVIYPCKTCVSTAMPLCHWPCSCYPNHALEQTPDWMNEIYPRWVAAHGVMILCPVNWYQVPSGLKLMMDRLVCADGGNPDPTTTGGKDPQKAKELELKGWDYPKHLAGRAFSVIVHGDAAGAETLRRMLADWLTDMDLIPAGKTALLDRYVGYYKPYATSHEELDRNEAFQIEVQNAARALMNQVLQLRSGEYRSPDEGLEAPVKK